MRTHDHDNPEELAAIARDYFINQLSQREIATLHGINQSTVAHRLERARERGIVSFDIDPEFALAGREHTGKSRQLRDLFRLRECLVVDAGDRSIYEDVRGDQLHRLIANTCGVRLREWPQPGDHLVVAGGRATLRVARFIKRTPPVRRDIRISPLSGRIWTGSWQEDGSENLRRPLDADDVARLLGFAFAQEPGTRFSQIGHPLYAESEDAARAVISEHCVFRSEGGWNIQWGFQPPGKALVGVGVLNPRSGHRITELVRRIADHPAEPVSQYLRIAAGRFTKALSFVDTHELPCFGDVANRLFPVLPLPRELKVTRLPSLEAYAKLAAMLDDINRGSVVMQWHHLREIPSVWVIGGGNVKHQAIWTLLLCSYLDHRDRRLIKELGTDLKTALEMEAAMLQYRAAPSAIRKWYETVASRVFPLSSLDTKPPERLGGRPRRGYTSVGR